MSTFTEHYGLIKPGTADYYDIADWNENMDAIDGAMAAQDRAAAEISERLGTPTTAGDTIFRLLEGNGGGVIKSMQTIDISTTTGGGTSSKAIEAVTPGRCLVIMSKMNDYNGITISYTLGEASISVSSTYSGSGSLTQHLRFQIIEFY